MKAAILRDRYIVSAVATRSADVRQRVLACRRMNELVDEQSAALKALVERPRVWVSRARRRRQHAAVAAALVDRRPRLPADARRSQIKDGDTIRVRPIALTAATHDQLTSSLSNGFPTVSNQRCLQVPESAGQLRKPCSALRPVGARIASRARILTAMPPILRRQSGPVNWESYDEFSPTETKIASMRLLRNLPEVQALDIGRGAAGDWCWIRPEPILFGVALLIRSPSSPAAHS